MKLSMTSWSLPACTLEEAAAISTALGIGALDLGLFYRSALDRERLLGDPAALADEVRALGVELPNYYHLFGDSLENRNLALEAHREENERDFAKVLDFCERAGIPTVFVLPGLVNPGQSRAEAHAASIVSLQRLVALAAERPVTLTVEPHVHGLLESPADTLRLIEQVEGLRLTLDYAHFICIGHTQDAIDALAPHAAHVHLRQAKPGALQTKIAAGTINMAAQFGTLRDAGFDGAISLEVVHQDYMGTIEDDVLTETVALRDLFRSWQDG